MVNRRDRRAGHVQCTYKFPEGYCHATNPNHTTHFRNSTSIPLAELIHVRLIGGPETALITKKQFEILESLGWKYEKL